MHESGAGTNRPCRLPLGLVRKLGSSCQWCARGTDLQQWKVDRPSAIRQSTGEDDPNRSFLVPCSWSKREELKDQTFATDVSGLLHNSLRAHPSEPQTFRTVATGRSKTRPRKAPKCRKRGHVLDFTRHRPAQRGRYAGMRDKKWGSGGFRSAGVSFLRPLLILLSFWVRRCDHSVLRTPLRASCGLWQWSIG